MTQALGLPDMLFHVLDRAIWDDANGRRFEEAVHRIVDSMETTTDVLLQPKYPALEFLVHRTPAKLDLADELLQTAVQTEVRSGADVEALYLPLLI